MENIENTDIQIDNEDENFESTRVSAFLNLERNKLTDRKLIDIIRSISASNSTDRKPLYIFRTAAQTLKLIFGNESAREYAATEGLLIFDVRVIVERPKPIRRDRTIYIYGMPITEDTRKISFYLEKTLKLTVKSDFRWLVYADTDIRNGGRSVIIESDLNIEIPGFVWYSSDSCKTARKIALWHVNMPIYCRRCMTKGHTSKDCTQTIDRPAIKTYVNAASFLRNRREPDAVAKPSFAEILSNKYDTQTLFSKNMPSKLSAPNVNTNSGSKSASIDEKIFPFYTKTDVLSNHYECDFTVDNNKYSTTEQYLFSEKAKHQGDTEACKRIMNNRAARYAKEIGEKVVWPDLTSWRDFAKSKLLIANEAKFYQNKDLRKFLFETSPKLLVEASPSDLFWGVGLRKTDRRVNNPFYWRGENVMGSMLTDLRDEMMSRSEFSDEAKEINESTNFISTSKRTHSASDGEDENRKRLNS